MRRPKPTLTPIGAEIDQLIRMRNLSKQDAADWIGVKRVAVSKICNGHSDPSIETLLRIEAVFGMPAAEMATRLAKFRIHEERKRLKNELSQLKRWTPTE